MSTKEINTGRAYNLIGEITALSLGNDRKGRPFARMDLLTASGRSFRCVAFGENHVDQIRQLTLAGNAHPVRLFGRFENSSWTAENGETRVGHRFVVLWAGEPKAKAERRDERQGELAI
jgi:hypothetical protein